MARCPSLCEIESEDIKQIGFILSSEGKEVTKALFYSECIRRLVGHSSSRVAESRGKRRFRENKVGRSSSCVVASRGKRKIRENKGEGTAIRVRPWWYFDPFSHYHLDDTAQPSFNPSVMMVGRPVY
ncbi:hypothetical protein NDU88_001685 [Pleurodeles waltl]|uniref:Uncharacterized protein n=1 Tax=Pleurodeles waltl TaxID=8319 RepID=A0AAV7ML35_PLEWA|nr:hypothetical protein NDU88_001685 [Pleurodeles waltl]